MIKEAYIAGEQAALEKVSVSIDKIDKRVYESLIKRTGWTPPRQEAALRHLRKAHSWFDKANPHDFMIRKNKHWRKADPLLRMEITDLNNATRHNPEIAEDLVRDRINEYLKYKPKGE